MLMILLYHRAYPCRYGNSLETLESHFKYLQKRSMTLPGEPLHKGVMNVCISFDDATYDFYHYVYPLLKRYHLKALLAVPVGYIEEKQKMPFQERLKLLEDFSFQRSPSSAAFCSFEELQEMVESGAIKIASHGMHHSDLSQKNAPLAFELQESKRILEKRLSQSIDTFVFPYGKYNPSALDYASQEYSHLMRIGYGLNFSWKDRLLYRVSVDQIEDLSQIFSGAKKAQFLLKKLTYYL